MNLMTTQSFLAAKRLADRQNPTLNNVGSGFMLTPIAFALGLVLGIAIGSATSITALTQGAPDVLQTWSGVVAMP